MMTLTQRAQVLSQLFYASCVESSLSLSELFRHFAEKTPSTKRRDCFSKETNPASFEAQPRKTFRGIETNDSPSHRCRNGKHSEQAPPGSETQIKASISLSSSLGFSVSVSAANERPEVSAQSASKSSPRVLAGDHDFLKAISNARHSTCPRKRFFFRL
jgi:hypothetical protein